MVGYNEAQRFSAMISLWLVAGERRRGPVRLPAGRQDFPASQCRVTKAFQLLLIILKVGNLAQGRREQ